MRHRNLFRQIAGFTIVELMVVVAIVAILATSSVPFIERSIDKARSISCMANLRQIGITVSAYSSDNDGKVPKIQNPLTPIYEAEEGAKSMMETLEPYGVTASLLRCPADVHASNRFAACGNSYEWRPIADEENKISPLYYPRRGDPRAAKPSRISITIDIDPVHFGRQNRLFLDGHVKAYTD